MGRRETQNIAKGIQQQALQRIAIPGCEQVVKILLDEGPAQAWSLFDAPVDMRRGDAGVVPESTFQVGRREGVLEKLWKVEPGIHIEAPAVTGALVIDHQ